MLDLRAWLQPPDATAASASQATEASTAAVYTNVKYRGTSVGFLDPGEQSIHQRVWISELYGRS